MPKSLKAISFYTLIILLSAVLTASAGTITGTVVYDGDAPKFKQIKMEADPICALQHKEAVFPQTLVLGENKEMGNVFVHLKSGYSKKAYPAPTEPEILTQQGCMYDPHVLGVMVGQPIKILNPDGTLHNVHALPKINAEFNLAMPKFRKETSKTFDKAEFMFPMKCDVHPWMGAWIAVMDHPYFNVTSSDGKFSLEDLPAGEYVVEAWHEKLPPRRETVVLAEGETKEIHFTFSRPQKKKQP